MSTNEALPHPGAATLEDPVLAAAAVLLVEDPAATMADVARAAGVGRATLYRRYASRDDLLRVIRLRALRECTEALAAVPVGTMTPPEALRASLHALMGVIDRYRVLAEAPRLDRRDPVQRSLAERVEEPIAAIVTEGARRGDFRADVPPAFVAAMVTGLLVVARRGVVEGGLEPARAEAEVLRALEAVLLPA